MTTLSPITFRRFPAPTARSQRGTILIIALMFLVALTLLALTSMRTTSLEEKMAGQYVELNMAFQSAEAALRDAERDLYGTGQSGFTPRVNVISGGTGFGDGSAAPAGTCSQGGAAGTQAGKFGKGLCMPSAIGPTPALPAIILTGILNPNDTTNNVRSVQFGDYTMSATEQAKMFPRSAARPRYVIEALCQGITPPVGTSIGGATGVVPCYHRITARGFGANPGSGGTNPPQTSVTLQEVYLKPLL